MTIALASIGYGRHFRRSLLPNVIAADDLTLVAVAERDPTSRETIHETLPGLRTTGGHREILESPDIDAVLISVDPSANIDLALEAVEAGKHVFVEKPVGTDPDAAARLARAADDAGVVVMTGTMWRFAPVHSVLDSWLAEQGTRAAFLNVNVTFPEIITRQGWAMSETELAFYDMFVHAIDWSLVHLPGAALRDIVAIPTSQPGRVEVSVRLQDDEGRLAVLNMAAGSHAYQIATWLHTERGDVAEIDTKERLRITTRPTWSRTEGWIRDRPTLNFEAGQVYRGFSRKGYAEELAEFGARIRDGRDHGTGAAQAAAALAVINQALSALAATGRP